MPSGSQESSGFGHITEVIQKEGSWNDNKVHVNSEYVLPNTFIYLGFEWEIVPNGEVFPGPISVIGQDEGM